MRLNCCRLRILHFGVCVSEMEREGEREIECEYMCVSASVWTGVCHCQCDCVCVWHARQHLICTIDFSTVRPSNKFPLTPSLFHSLSFLPSLCCYLSVVNFMRIFSFACLSGRLYRNLLCLFNWIRIADAGDNFATECAAASAQITPSGAEREKEKGKKQTERGLCENVSNCECGRSTWRLSLVHLV